MRYLYLYHLSQLLVTFNGPKLLQLLVNWQHITYWSLYSYYNRKKIIKTSTLTNKLEITMPLNRHSRFGQSPNTLAMDIAPYYRGRAYEMYVARQQQVT